MTSGGSTKRLVTPVPEVLAWSSNADDNAVGAEYIIMEKAPGVELERVRPTMQIKDRLAVVKAISVYKKAWTSVSFKSFGGLYYSKDLDAPAHERPLYTDSEGVEVADGTFAIGPPTAREWIDDGRATIEMDRGPCMYLSRDSCS